jgi:integrase
MVDSIKDLEFLEKFKNELRKINYRNYMLFVFGINTGLRVGDIIKFKVNDIKSKSNVDIIEEKTGKSKRIYINDELKTAITEYIETKKLQNDDFVFQTSYDKTKSITANSMWRILKNTGRKLGVDNIGSHTMRKTFGYHFYNKTKDIAMLQHLFNHSSATVTLRYIGITHESIENELKKFVL